MVWVEVVIIILLVACLLSLLVLLRRVSLGKTAASQEHRAGLADLSSERDAVAGRAAHIDQRAADLEARQVELEALHQELLARHDELEVRREELGAAAALVKSDREDLEGLARRERDSQIEIHEQLTRREELMTRREQRLEQGEQDHASREQSLGEAERAVAQAQRETAEEQSRARTELERVAALTADQARAEVLQRAEHDARLDSARVVRDIERDTAREADSIARRIITTSIQRLAADQTADAVVTAVHLPSEEMKGRIIGREGRNIRTFEQVTGVNVLIDDTPETVLLSSFDPVRREVARVTLEALVADGRIQPGRIEEMHARSLDTVNERCHRAAEDALAEVGITDLDADLVPILGSLKYRTSYGQNVLAHMVESAHLAGMMAHELGLDATTSKRAAFLHDIGKALTHEVEGPHAEIGADLCRRHGEHDDVVHAIAAHHNEIEPRTVEALLVQAADAISGSRPGARRESLEAHMHRMQRLEDIAMEQPGVDRAFAMQAGRELRIMVLPEEVDDLGAQAIARGVARTIEEELTYPGQIRVTVVRESRATQTAH